MKYLSLFSGIEAATVGWHHLGWQCIGVSEIDPFACEVLKQRLPNTPNLGDITKITKEQLNEIRSNGLDIVVGGSPCQAFSVAGLRKGLEDPRGNLMLQYIRVVATILPTYFIWENVPGVLSSNGGRDFGTLLQAMEKLGYNMCWRTLDSKNFGVPQRRRRVFLVGSLANNRHPFEILFESESVQRDNSKSRETRQDNTSKTTTSTEEHDEIILLKNNRSDGNMYEKAQHCFTLTAAMGEGGGHVPMTTYRLASLRTGGNVESNVSPTLTSTMGSGDTLPVTTYIAEKQYAATLCARDHKGIATDSFGKNFQQLVNTKTKVRRLTPIECERLQGFPDNWTQIAWKGKEPKDCPISHRYKCLGNSMTTNVMRWIGERIADVPSTISKKKYHNEQIYAIGCDLYNASIDTKGTCPTLTARGNPSGSGPRVIVKKKMKT
jgi:DNA (cytosine-5)-methyltransferase 1